MCFDRINLDFSIITNAEENGGESGLKIICYVAF
jgi:hypothetical protein